MEAMPLVWELKYSLRYFMCFSNIVNRKIYYLFIIVTSCGGFIPAVFSANLSPVFINQTNTLSINHQYTGEWEFFVGGGVSVFDCNNDDLPDIYLAGGSSTSKLLINTSLPQGKLNFRYQLSETVDVQGVTGAYVLDINNDDILDLVVMRVGENQLLQGLGDCNFKNVTKEWKFKTTDQWTTAFSAFWEEAYAWPTLVFGNYVDRRKKDNPFGACDFNQLYRPNNKTYSTFKKLEPSYCPLSMLISDWSHTGKPDLRISNDRHYYLRGGAEQLWHLTEEPALYSQNEGWNHLSIWGMGIASRDITGDGLPEIFLTSMGDQKLRVLKKEEGNLRPEPRYYDESYKRGTNANVPYIGDEGRPSSGWHAEFGDINNDGLDDLFIAKGNVNQMTNIAVKDPNNLLIQNSQGKFIENGLSAGLATLNRSRGAALADLNLDGRLDIVVNNRLAQWELNQNVSSHIGNWLSIDLRQDNINRRAVGAWIIVRANDRVWYREITIGGGHAGAYHGPQHFGLGEIEQANIEIFWPDGSVSNHGPVLANQLIRIDKP